MLRLATIIFTISILLLINYESSGQAIAFELKTVVIDAGHGGKDPGATIGNTKEKDIVLEVALITGEIIKKQYPNVNVIYTRTKDVFVPLAQRAELANNKKADLFISIHVNSYKFENISGAETYILGNHRSEDNLKVAQKENSVILLEDDYTTRYEGFDPNSAESYIMFELIQNEYLEQSRFFADQLQKSFIDKGKRKDRGVRQAGFLVLRQTTMPSVLVELGFISNNNEKTFLISEAGKQEMAKSIADAFSTYKNRVDTRSNPSFSEKEKPKNVKEENKVDEVGVDKLDNVKKIEKIDEIDHEKNKNNNGIIDIQQVISNGDWYGIQILACKYEYTKGFTELNTTEPIYYLKENGWYKYYVGLTQNYNEAIKQHKQLKLKFKTSFIVNFKNGIKNKIISY